VRRPYRKRGEPGMEEENALRFQPTEHSVLCWSSNFRCQFGWKPPVTVLKCSETGEEVKQHHDRTDLQDDCSAD
jgi:hypothetical protein